MALCVSFPILSGHTIEYSPWLGLVEIKQVSPSGPEVNVTFRLSYHWPKAAVTQMKPAEEGTLKYHSGTPFAPGLTGSVPVSIFGCEPFTLDHSLFEKEEDLRLPQAGADSAILFLHVSPTLWQACS